jgi:hypothetical protein
MSFRAKSRNGGSLGSCGIDGNAGGQASGSERVNLGLISSNQHLRALSKVAHVIEPFLLALFV